MTRLLLRPLCLAGVLVFAAAVSRAQDERTTAGGEARSPVNDSWRDAREACGEVFGPGSGTERYLGHGIDCGIRIFSLEPIGPSVGKVVPGGGEAFGAASNLDVFKSDRWQNTWSSQIRGSATGFWTAHSQLELQRHALDGVNYNPNITLYATFWDLPQMRFYGLGSDTAKSDLAYFSQRETFGGVSANYPLKIQSETNERTGETRYHAALVLGGVFEVRAPRVGGVSTAGLTSIDQRFTEQTAPGLLPGPDTFIRSEASLAYRHAITDPRTILQLSFDDYHDVDSGGRYSFQRVEATADQVVFSRPQAGRLFMHGRVSTSMAGGGSQVPFYYQETLGGSDINGVDTLRGYDDYRFRAPNLWLAQITYERAVTVSVPRKAGGPVTFDIAPSVFDDLGDVAADRADLFAHAKNTFGVGLALCVGNRTLARAYLGFGSEERPHFFLDFSSLAFQ